jgi:hypothetical protein
MPLVPEIRYWLRCDGITTMGPLTEPCSSFAGPTQDTETVLRYARAQNWTVVDDDDNVLAYCPRHDPLREKRTEAPAHSPEPVQA